MKKEMKKVKLSFEDAKREYINRFTMEHVPAWAKKPLDNGKYYAPQYKSDQEWYDNTVFPPFTMNKKYCESSNATWPLGQFLSEPFEKK
jgi:hypothetical protein